MVYNTTIYTICNVSGTFVETGGRNVANVRLMAIRVLGGNKKMKAKVIYKPI